MQMVLLDMLAHCQPVEQSVRQRGVVIGMDKQRNAAGGDQDILDDLFQIVADFLIFRCAQRADAMGDHRFKAHRADRTAQFAGIIQLIVAGRERTFHMLRHRIADAGP